MHYILKRASVPELYNARAQRYRLLSAPRVKRCGTCTFEVPEGDIVLEDGAERCPMCKDVLTAEWKSNEERDVAAVKSAAWRALYQPPQFSVRALQEARPGVVTAINDANGHAVYSSSPLTQRIGDAPATTPPSAFPDTVLTLVGQRFLATDVVTLPTGYSNLHTVITSTAIELSIYPNTATVGRYSLQFNGHVFRDILAAIN
jgi:hypothetical protein